MHKHYSPKFCAFLLMETLACLTGVRAQGRYVNKRAYRADERYFSIYSGFGMVNSRNSPASLSVSFPYVIQGTTTAFDKSIPHAFSYNVGAANFFHVAWGRSRTYYDLGIDGFNKLQGASAGMHGSIRVSGAAGVNFNVFKGPMCRTPTHFIIRPSVELSYGQINLNLGSVNNTGVQISALGFTAAPTYTYMSGGKYNRHLITAYANQLNFQLNERITTIAPRISITSNPYKHRFHWSLDAAYWFMIKRVELIDAYQSAGKSDPDHQLGHVSLTHQGLCIYSNNAQTTSIPFSLSGLYVGFTVGINVIPDR